MNPMSHFPDFSELGYQITRELGHNRTGGRVTYLATRATTEQPVVLKLFQFVRLNASPGEASWSDYDALNQEIQLLQQLNHPSIPHYLDGFETPAGFCLVQEYKQAPSLAQPHLFTPEEIKQIATAVLEVLVYLQQQVPLVIHRDIKPDNILVDRSNGIKVYLVDFGFARMGGGEVAVSSVVKGTLGFMPPEQLFNRQLSAASDLYSLGATLICLLTQTKSMEIGHLIDEDYRINFKQRLPQLSSKFIHWLEKMTAPSLKDRFNNAKEALEALEPIEVVATTTSSADTTRRGTDKTLGIATTLGFSFAALLSFTSWISWIGQPQQTENSRVPLIQLLATHQCPKCDLQGAKLWGADLQEAKLGGANLWGADLWNANLVGADLRYASLSNATLGTADLSDANLSYSKLQYVDLAGAKLGGADLRSAYLETAKLEGAYLGGADLRGAYLGYANLEKADLRGSNLGYSNLGNANLGNANLSVANLWGANLGDANLEGAKLERADLREAQLENANLGGAKLAGADLRNANLRGAKLWGVDLTGANLEGANLEGAKLGGAQMERANLNKVILTNATMPDGTIHD